MMNDKNKSGFACGKTALILNWYFFRLSTLVGAAVYYLCVKSCVSNRKSRCVEVKSTFTPLKSYTSKVKSMYSNVESMCSNRKSICVEVKSTFTYIKSYTSKVKS